MTKRVIYRLQSIDIDEHREYIEVRVLGRRSQDGECFVERTASAKASKRILDSLEFEKFEYTCHLIEAVHPRDMNRH